MAERLIEAQNVKLRIEYLGLPSQIYLTMFVKGAWLQGASQVKQGHANTMHLYSNTMDGTGGRRPPVVSIKAEYFFGAEPPMHAGFKFSTHQFDREEVDH